MSDHVDLECVPVIVEIDSSQALDALCTIDTPPHARTFHPVFDEVATRTFHDATANRIALHQVFIVLHVNSVVLEVSQMAFEFLQLASFQSPLLRHLPECADDAADAAFQDLAELLFKQPGGFRRVFRLEGNCRAEFRCSEESPILDTKVVDRAHWACGLLRKDQERRPTRSLGNRLGSK
ncbi:MAG: hypothetical protein GXX96_26670 [Planctomycetaceae bacterium]|nr:hypothetical protein [Planctomycetaceae bacterium]